MRHIPEDELHAYLDQGLSRSQCVEIESHLAGCPSCRANRDGIAALRDRTTALLAKLAPPRRFPPAFEALRDEAAQRLDTRRRRLRIGAWAASLIAAVGLGWTASSVIRPSSPDAIATRSAPRPVEPVMNAALPDSAERRTAPSPAPSVAVVQPSAPAPAVPARQAVRDERTDSVQAAREAKLAVLDPVPRRWSSRRSAATGPTAASSSTESGERCRGTARVRRPARMCLISTACRCCESRSRPTTAASGR